MLMLKYKKLTWKRVVPCFAKILNTEAVETLLVYMIAESSHWLPSAVVTDDLFWYNVFEADRMVELRPKAEPWQMKRLLVRIDCHSKCRNV